MMIITQLKPKDKKKVRIMLDKIIDLKKRELGIFERNIINQIKDNIKTLQEVKKGRLPIEVGLEKNKKCSEYISNFLNARNGMKNGNEL